MEPGGPRTERAPTPEAPSAGESDSDDDCYVLDGFVVADTDDVQTSRPPGTEVDERNIVTGKRRRRGTRFIYEDPEFADAVASTMLADVPPDELDAAISGDCGDAVILSDSDSDSDSEDGHRPVRHRVPVPLGSDEESDDDDDDYELPDATGSDDTATSEDEDEDEDEDA